MLISLGQLATLGLPVTAWLISAALATFGTWLAFRHWARRLPARSRLSELPPVSILKPLKGADPGLSANLRSFFELEYPCLELCLSVASEDDPATSVVRRLLSEYPGVNARLQIGAVDAGPNPKVSNLVIPYAAAQHDWILISDSNTRVDSKYLLRLMRQVGPDTGVLTAIVGGQSPRGWGGRLEQLYLHTFYARAMLVADWAGHPCVIGKSMLFRRSVADRFGGMAILGRYLAEDYMAGEAMRRLGYRVQIARDPIAQYIGRYSAREFWARHVRWGRIRKAQSPFAFAAELAANPWIAGLGGALAFTSLTGRPALEFALGHALGCWLTDLGIHLRMQRAISGQRWRLGPQAVLELLRTSAVWVVLMALSLPLWLTIAAGRTVRWRGQDLVIGFGGVLESSPRADRT